MGPLRRRTWAPRGHTPQLLQRGRSRRKVSVIGALVISPRPQLAEMAWTPPSLSGLQRPAARKGRAVSMPSRPISALLLRQRLEENQLVVLIVEVLHIAARRKAALLEQVLGPEDSTDCRKRIAWFGRIGAPPRHPTATKNLCRLRCPLRSDAPRNTWGENPRHDSPIYVRCGATSCCLTRSSERTRVRTACS